MLTLPTLTLTRCASATRLTCRQVGADAQEAGEAQPPVRSVLPVADLDHQLRAYPVGVLGVLAGQRRGERRLPGGQRRQGAQQRPLVGGGDAAADPAAVVEPAAGRGYPDQQGTQAARAGAPAADHEVAGGLQL